MSVLIFGRCLENWQDDSALFLVSVNILCCDFVSVFLAQAGCALLTISPGGFALLA